MAILKTELRDDHLPSRYDPSAIKAYNKYIVEYLNGPVDERTSLAEAEEEANSAIADLKGK